MTLTLHNLESRITDLAFRVERLEMEPELVEAIEILHDLIVVVREMKEEMRETK